MFETSDAFGHYWKWSFKIAQISGPRQGMKRLLLFFFLSNFIQS